MGTVSPLPRPRALTRIADGLANLYSRLGTSADRNTLSSYMVPVLDQQQIEAAYRTSWLTRKIHDLPPFEMTRAGRVWQAEADQITKLEEAERKFDVWGKLRAALTTARLHGGGAIVLGVRQGLPDSPLVVDRLGANTLQYALVLSKHQLSAPMGMDNDPTSDYFGQPLMYELRGARGNTVRIHPSRVIPFHGAPLPSGCLTVSGIEQFWGDPVLLAIKSAIDNAETSQAAVATLLHEMKQDVISIPGLTETIATEGAEGSLAARIGALNTFRSMFNALLLDGGDDEGKGGEKWETRQLSFAQHPELLRQFIAIVAGAADIPVTRLMGESPGGMQSTGKGEQHDFNRMIAALQGVHLSPALARFDDIFIRSTLGSRDADIGYTFAPLSESDEQQESENEKREAETVQIYAASNLIPKDALAKSTANRLIESGRWPGLDQAIKDSAEELGALDEPDADPLDVPPAANDDEAVDRMERRGTITRDQAIALLADAAPRSLYVRRDLLNTREFTAWAEGQGLSLQSGLHVTIAYSETPVDWFKVNTDDWAGSDGDGKLTVSAGGPRAIERFDGGALVLQFGSSRLGWRHEEIVRAGATHKYPDYAPHVTLLVGGDIDPRTIEPYRGKLEFGPEIFEEIR